MKKHIAIYKEARAAHIAAKNHQETTLREYRAFPFEKRRENIGEIKALADAHTNACRAEERAARIRAAAAHIAEQHTKAAAAPVIMEVLKKYEGKPAGPKTREKAAAEIAAALGARSAYFSGSYYGSSVNHVCIHFDGIDNEVSPEIYSDGWEPMVNNENRFTRVNITPPDLSTLPEDLEAWADEFDRATGELEAAREAFEAAATNARRVNLGNARLTEYRITR